MGELFATFGINGKLLLIQAVNFGILLFVLHRYLYRPVLDMLDKRRDMVTKGVQDAESAALKLSQAETDADAKRSQAVREGEDIVAAAKNAADQKGSLILAEARTKAEQAMTDAKLQAAEIMRREREAGAKELARAATLAAEKILRGKNA